MTVNKRPLGKTGLYVSEIAFGGVEIGLPYGLGIHNQEDMLPEKEAIRLLHSAIERGINFFDTARLYGKSETIMGKALRNKRKEVVLSTKCKHFRDSDGKVSKEKELRKIIQSSLKESLQELQTSYVDVFMLHQSDLDILENEEIPKIFGELKQSGLIRATGTSTYTAAETKMAVKSGHWDVIQLPFNLMDQRQQSFFESASSQGIGIIIRSVLLKGLLSERGRDLHPSLKHVEQHISKYRSLIDDSTRDLSALAVKFALSFPEVSSVLVGIDKKEYLEHSVKAANGNYLNKSVLEKARLLQFPNPEFLDLRHWDKMGWL